MGTSGAGDVDYGTERDHPHACGDKADESRRFRQEPGSSPRVWGQGCKLFGADFVQTIIPTRVGTRQGKAYSGFAFGDHPHACGDKLIWIYGISLIAGSSPRVWGQASSVNIFPFALGIIPTRVGTSYFFGVIAAVKQDHPHACGDKKLSRLMAVWTLGSSPRVWGQARMVKAREYEVRIIPTRVGTSQRNLLNAAHTLDHPHACGDKINFVVAPVSSVGSSPRVWGQGSPLYFVVNGGRIIPTRVGTRWIAVIKQAVNEDHPHACGDKLHGRA